MKEVKGPVGRMVDEVRDDEWNAVRGYLKGLTEAEAPVAEMNSRCVLAALFAVMDLSAAAVLGMVGQYWLSLFLVGVSVCFALLAFVSRNNEESVD